ncbi:hypothetical protein MHH56_13750 [Paenibacillus sp. FSL K6-3182]|uniref:hypothetical protein n=1 Tax=Paenibacillus sp. FSL K6-3182 TaxID=2921495 RepID=UPI0030CEDBA0
MAMIWVAIIVGLIYLLVAASRYNKRLERDAFRRGAYAFSLAIHHQGLGILAENCKRRERGAKGNGYACQH